MSDPRRHKNKVEIYLEGKYTSPSGEVPLRLFHTANKEVVSKIPEPELRKMLEQDVKEVSPTPVSGIFNMHARFQYGDPNALADFDYGNTLVEAHIPYCLHIPNEHEFEVVIPEENKKALITFRKIWTRRATEDRSPSSPADFYAEDRVVYFQRSTVLPPRMPCDPSEGWQQFFTGRNIEEIKGKGGVFRYSKLYIQFDYSPDISKLDGKESQDVLNEVKEVALGFVNRVIDSYRITTQQAHIQRLGSLSTNLIYFKELNHGYYLSSFGFGVETAPMNRSRKEVKTMEEMLGKGERPELYELLLLDANSSFDTKDYALAVVQSFQALEILLEKLLTSALINRGDSEPEKYLNQHWKTKERIKECLKELKNTSLFEADRPLWDKWCTLYDQTRNEIVHRGKEPKSKEVADVLETNVAILNWLKSL